MSTSADSFKLYYSQQSCGAASFLVCNAAGLNFEPYETDISKHKVAGSDQDFYAINPKGNVPTVVLPGGHQLNENVSVLLFLADQGRKGGKQGLNNLAPAEGSIDRYLFINLLSFLATEIHKGCYFRLFSDGMLARSGLKTALLGKLKLLNDQLEQNKFQYIFSNDFTVADAYLFVMLRWNAMFDISLRDNHLPALDAYFQRIEAMPFVKESDARMKQLHETHSQKSQ